MKKNSLIILCFGLFLFIGCKKKYSNELIKEEISLAVDISPEGAKQAGSSLYSFKVNGYIIASRKVDMAGYGFVFTPLPNGTSYINKYGPASKLGLVSTTFVDMPPPVYNEYNQTLFYIILLNGDTIKTSDIKY